VARTPEPIEKRVRWTRAYRIVPSRFPPVGVFDRIADPADLEALYEIEALTNPRLRDELGALRMVPKERRVSGAGSTPIWNSHWPIITSALVPSMDSPAFRHAVVCASTISRPTIFSPPTPQ
jgi:hypothetical protein